ncbi:MAG: U32 family peptidase [Tissierellia bacterium]|nr:U32 family peptidase [Tissierellia bacterium]
MKAELLAPAGSIESFYAAVNSGADSVYLGGKFFNARHSSQNFDDVQMKYIIKYAHNKNVKVYVTMNTLLKDTEIIDALNYAAFLYENDVDAVIVQDLGLLYLLNKYIPGLAVNISTQAVVYDEHGAKFFENYDVEKVIMARELSLERLKEIAKNTEANLEVFIHGALCTCYSGQCYMSSFLGGRSGNRGKCAQPCRLNYSIYNKEQNQDIKDFNIALLSLKDFIAGESIYELIEGGIKTFKIEGRMKGPAYTSSVVEYYRQIIDNYYDGGKVDVTDLKNKTMATFSRGYTNGYLKPSKDEEMFAKLSSGIRDIEIDEEVREKAREYSKFRRNKISFKIDLKIGKEAILTASDHRNTLVVKGDLCESSIENPVTDEIIKEQLLKLGNTIYEAEVEIIKEEGVFIRKSSLNKLRRDATQLLFQKSGNWHSRNEKLKFSYNDLFPFVKKESVTPKISLKINDDDEVGFVKGPKVKRLYFPYYLNLTNVKKMDVEEKYLWIPSIVSKTNYKVLKNNIKLYEKLFDGVCVNNVGSFNFFKENSNLKIHCGPYFNIINSFSAELLNARGGEGFTFSVEANIRDMESIMKHSKLRAEVVAHAYVQLMVMKNCPMSLLKNCKNLQDCEKCSYRNSYALKDRKGVYFNLERHNRLTHIYNSLPLTILGRAFDFVKTNVEYFLIDTKFLKDTEEVINALYCEIKGIKTEYSLKENSFTRGHYFKNML